MTAEHEGGHPIPDFEKDAQAIASYDEAKLRFERGEIHDAESRTRNGFMKKREAIRAEIAVAMSILEERRLKADQAFRAYAARYPNRIERNKPVKPTFWESLLSLGGAGRMFNRAVITAREAVEAQSLRRRKEHDEEELEQQLKRAIYLQEDAIKKKLESPEGLASFHARPGIAPLLKRIEEIKAERAAYAVRLERGAVPPQEQRDREFAERKISQLIVPFSNVTIVHVARYGHLSYYVMRDLERKLYHLSYDARLEPLVDNVIDVYRLADSYEARISRNDEFRPMAVAEHYARNFKDEEVARSEYRRARTVLRAPRTDLAPMTPIDAAERELLDLLAQFARTVGPGAMAALQQPNLPPVLDAVGKPDAAAEPGS